MALIMLILLGRIESICQFLGGAPITTVMRTALRICHFQRLDQKMTLTWTLCDLYRLLSGLRLYYTSQNYFKPRAQSLVIQFQKDKDLVILMPISLTFLLSKACLKVSSKQ